MRLGSKIFVERAPEVVCRFLGDVSNVSKWDRGVGEAKQTSSGKWGVGAQFDTVGHAGTRDGAGTQGKMSYRLVSADEGHSIVELTSTNGNARFFRRAIWDFRVVEAAGGSTVICVADFTLRRRYWFMGPVLFFMKWAIRGDLEALKRAVEKGTAATVGGR